MTTKKDISVFYAATVLFFMALTTVNTLSSLDQQKTIAEMVILQMSVVLLSLLILLNMMIIAYYLVKNNINYIIKNANDLFSFNNIAKQAFVLPLISITVFSVFLMYSNIIHLDITITLTDDLVWQTSAIDISVLDINFWQSLASKGTGYAINSVYVLVILSFFIPTLICWKALGYANECTIVEVQQFVYNLLMIENNQNSEEVINEMITKQIQQEQTVEQLLKTNQFLTMFIAWNDAKQIVQTKESNFPPLTSF